MPVDFWYDLMVREMSGHDPIDDEELDHEFIASEDSPGDEGETTPRAA